jgi:16S rRNA (cytidine1402-2'-O)-methyltransferase
MRHTARLLSAAGIHNRTESLHEHNEDARIPPVLERLRGNQKIALVSDAGTPLLSDPGYRLVRAAIAADLPVTAVPGPNAALTALTLSGLPPMPYLFLGFPSARQAARRSMFSGLRGAERAGLSATLIFYEAPHRLNETLGDLLDTFGDRAAAVARELTKRFETVKRGKIQDLIGFFSLEPPRGEITVMIGPPENEDHEALDERLNAALQTMSVKDAAAVVAMATGLPRKIVYAHALRIMEGR